jgi:hypothetical protein
MNVKTCQALVLLIYVNNYGDYYLVGGGGWGRVWAGRRVACGVRGGGHPSLLFKFKATPLTRIQVEGHAVWYILDSIAKLLTASWRHHGTLSH